MAVTHSEADKLLQIEKIGITSDLPIFPQVVIEYKSKTPMTDGKTVYLPPEINIIPTEVENILQDPNLTLYIGSLFHELGHVRYKSAEVNLKEYVESFEVPTVAEVLMQLLEDSRITGLFRTEFQDDRGKILDMTTKFFLSKIKYHTDENGDKLSPVWNFAVMLHSLLLYDKLPGHFGSRKEREEKQRYELEFLSTAITNEDLNKRNIYTVKDLLAYAYNLAKPLVTKGYTVLETAKIAKQLYDYVVKAFNINKEDKEACKQKYEEIKNQTQASCGGIPSQDVDISSTSDKPKLEDVEKNSSMKEDLRSEFVKNLERTAEQEEQAASEKPNGEQIIENIMTGYKVSPRRGEGRVSGEDVEREIDKFTSDRFKKDLVRIVLERLRQRGYSQDKLEEIGKDLVKALYE
ncbi:hypothetical protein J7L02_02205 [Candidatus Woesearchaeota archaeon]|nr:hypothetical protein [Candidatus Woesearchaeota archaeon]